jgi:tetratricopeptide (TPR) repeat protein
MEKKGRALLRYFALPALALALCWWAVPAHGKNLNQAEELYSQTNYEGSLALLDTRSEDPATDFLAGRDYFMLGEFKKAVDYFQKATSEAPNRSDYFDWLGRAYGRRAELANPLSAVGLASKARQAFETAVQLDPKNSDALSDLFDYYLNAPGLLGGGYDKAAVVAQKIAVIDPPEGYAVKAKLDQKRREYSTAERHLRAAVSVAPQQVGHAIALANFLAKQGRTKESDAVLAQAEQEEPNSARLWFARADLLIQQKRDLDQAKILLKKYVQAPVTVDDPPKQEALRLLKQVGGA